MKLGKPVKILIGILTAFITIMPVVILLGYFIIFAFTLLSAMPGGLLQQSETDFEIFLSLFMLLFCFLLWFYQGIRFALRIFYMIHIIKNKTLTDTRQIIYALGVFYLSFIAMPVYFFKCIWQEDPQIFDVRKE